MFVDEFGDDENVGGFGTLNGSVTATAVTLTGNVDADTLRGTGNDDLMLGLGGNDTLIGFAGADTLNGGTGLDKIFGGTGDDLYIVDLSADVAVESVCEGEDTVQSSATWFLGPNFEHLSLTGIADINGTGNDLDNNIFGNVGANVLNGQTGADAMFGNLGDDTYFVDNAGDTVTEVSAVGGTDLVNSSVTFALLSNVENLNLTGGADINGSGNTLVNILNGNGGDNVLNGAGGADTMTGFAGDDTYFVDNAGDVVTEGAAAGTDLCRARSPSPWTHSSRST